MFGCSDVYHWMGRTAKAVCLPDCGRHLRPKSHDLDALLGNGPQNFGQTGHGDRQFDAGLSSPDARSDSPTRYAASRRALAGQHRAGVTTIPAAKDDLIMEVPVDRTLELLSSPIRRTRAASEDQR